MNVPGGVVLRKVKAAAAVALGAVGASLIAYLTENADIKVVIAAVVTGVVTVGTAYLTAEDEVVLLPRVPDVEE